MGACYVPAALHNGDLGGNEEQRMLEAARRWAWILGGLAWSSMLWVLLYPRPYKLAVGATIVLPILAVISLRFFDGALKFDAPKGSRQPTIAMAFLLPPAAVLVRASEFNILAWSALWVPFVLFSVALWHWC